MPITDHPHFARARAKAAGLTRYVGHRPCPQGHSGERHTASGKCCQCTADWKARNPELVKEALRRHRRERPDLHSAYSYKQNHKPETRERRRKWANARYDKKRLTPKRDPVQKRISGAMRARMYHALKKAKDRTSWERWVPYTIDELRKHIERQWVKGMSWDNFGEWDIDHILPVAGFKLKDYGDEEFNACWALSNLRPLWTRENRSKGAKRLHLL